MIVWCSLLFEMIPFSGDSSRTGPFCASPVAYSIVLPIEGELASTKNQSWFFVGCFVPSGLDFEAAGDSVVRMSAIICFEGFKGFELLST